MSRTRVENIAGFLLRVVAGLLFFQHGGTKLLGWFGGLPDGSTPALLSLIGIAGLLEFVGGAAVLLGLLTRPVAFILSGQMAVAYFMAHQPKGTWPVENGGEPAVLFCFIFLFLAAYGGGPWSLDAKLWRKRPGPQAV